MSVDKRHLLKSAYNYTQAGQWDRALEEYRKITRLFPDDANIHSMIADLLAKRGDAIGACREHLEAARLFKAQSQEEKELSSLRKALRAQGGDSAATEALRAHFTRALQQAARLMADGKLADAEAVAGRLLDAEPGNLDANRLMDDLKAAQAAAQARQAMEEEAAAAPPPMVDAAAEVIQRLEGAVAGYLAAEDFDNAIETMLVILKLDPGRTSVQVQLAQAQSQVMVKQAAQQKWQELQRQSAEAPVAEAKETVQDVDLAAWRDEEEAVRRRLEEEQRIAEEAARHELGIIEAAVRELQAARSPAAASAAPLGGESPEEDPRLQALLVERRAAEQRLAEERQEAERREQEAAQARAKDAELQQHSAEMARHEAEAKAKAEALAEIERRLAEEREANRRQIEEERARLQSREEALQAQLKELMRSEMQRMQAEAKESAMRELQAQLDAERRQRQALETEATQRMSQAEAVVQRERDRMDAEHRAAEEAARKERAAVDLLKRQEEERRRLFLAEAVKRRQARQGGGSQKAAVVRDSRRISDVLHAATTKHLGQDVEAMLETARRYLKQDLLLDAMRICQTIAETDPENEKVKSLLKEIYERKGI